MSMPISGVTTRPAARPGPAGAGRGRGRRAAAPPARVRWPDGRAVRSNRKATAGVVLLAIFILVALFPGLIAHDNPNADAYAPRLGLSSAHLLGTTASARTSSPS